LIAFGSDVRFLITFCECILDDGQCTPLQISGAHLYAKIGCMERETFTSTKLQLHVYTDQQCSQQYNDGQSARRHTSRGYDFGGYLIPSKVSFKPEFYSCLTCSPDQISQTFNKINSNWYDDDHISAYGNQYAKYSNGGDDGGGRHLVAIGEQNAEVRRHSRHALSSVIQTSHSPFPKDWSDSICWREDRFGVFGTVTGKSTA
jgi:hypothetical protein